jgi:hypothetical protein
MVTMGSVRTALRNTALITCALAVFTAAVPVAAQFDAYTSMPDTGTSASFSFAERFGLDTLGGEFTTINPGGAWALMDSSYSLAAVDPLSGALIPTDVSSVLSPDRMVVHDMMERNLLAFDVSRAADDARMMADAARRAAEAREGMVNFSSCGHPDNPGFEARSDTVAAWERMCAAASADRVSLQIVSAYRSPEHQARLYKAAVAEYGSPEAARRWVAFSDGQTCYSKHCEGVAIDVNVSSNAAAKAWLHAVVGCYVNGESNIGPTSCSSGRPIKRVQLYGFILPMAHEPWHIELAAPL